MGGKVEGDRRSVTVMTGPTASGKSRAALERALADPSIEIVNADAQLLYRGFDIGTAKPTMEERAGVKHHLIDILDPNEKFSAAEYATQARNAIRDIFERGRTPLVVGGTGFYIDALFRGLMISTVTDEKLAMARSRFASELAKEGFEKMHLGLKTIDPDLYSQIAREMNPIRLERAWTHYYATGTTLGEARKVKRDTFEYEPEFVVIDLPRPELWKRIALRIDAMLNEGWVGEVRGLLSKGVDRNSPAMRAIGYLELLDVIEGKSRLDAAREAIIIRTRQFAKRQVTWIRHQTLS